MAVPFVWLHPQAAHAPKALRQQLAHARDFSKTMHGAALLYNLMLAQTAGRQELVEQYHSRIPDWSGSLAEHRPELLSTYRAEFWATVHLGNPYVPSPARGFVESWLDCISPGGAAANIASNSATRHLISERERKLKGGQARLHNRRALEMWSGAAGVSQLDYRWRNAQTILNDLAKGLRREPEYA